MPPEHLVRFTELLALDLMVLRLHDLPEKVYPVRPTNPTKAAAKLHVVMNAVDGSLARVTLMYL